MELHYILIYYQETASETIREIKTIASEINV